MDTILLEVDAQNCDMFFRPCQHSLRGRLDFAAIPEKEASPLVKEWRGPLPGQRIELDFTAKRGRILEVLHDMPQQKAKIEKMGFSLAPREQPLSWDGATLHYWTRRGIEAGLLRIVQGQLPAKQSPGAVKRNWIFKSAASAKDRQIDLLTRTVTVLTQLVLAGMPADKRKQVSEQLQDMDGGE